MSLPMRRRAPSPISSGSVELSVRPIASRVARATSSLAAASKARYASAGKAPALPLFAGAWFCAAAFASSERAACASDFAGAFVVCV